MQPIVWAQMAGAVPEDVRGELSKVTTYQLRALVQLEGRGLTRQFADAMQISRRTAIVLPDRLMTRGLTMTVVDAHDKRVVRLVPTKRGLALAGQFRTAQRGSPASLFDRLRDEQVDAMLDVMETLASAGPRGVRATTQDLLLELAR